MWGKYCRKYKWAATWQNQQNGMCTQWRLVHPAKTRISLGIRPVWSASSLCAQWVAKAPSFLHADSDGRTVILLVLSCCGSNAFVELFKKRPIDCCLQDWHSGISKLPKSIFYCKYKLILEAYIGTWKLSDVFSFTIFVSKDSSQFLLV